MNLDALVIDPATQTISALQISVNPHVKTALARIIGRQPKFAWISFRSAIAYDATGGAPAFFTINGSPQLRRKAVVLDFAGGAFLRHHHDGPRARSHGGMGRGERADGRREGPAEESS